MIALPTLPLGYSNTVLDCTVRDQWYYIITPTMATLRISIRGPITRSRSLLYDLGGCEGLQL